MTKLRQIIQHDFYRNLFLTGSGHYIHSSDFMSANFFVGFKSLIQFRCRYFRTVERIARLVWDWDDLTNLCPFCNVHDQNEEIFHLLSYFNTWNMQRSIKIAKFENPLD